MNSNNINFSQAQLAPLVKLSKDVEESDAVVKGKMSSFLGKIVLWFAFKVGFIPKWAKHHITITKQFDAALKKLKASKHAHIPPEVLKNAKTPSQLAAAIAQAEKDQMPPELLAVLSKSLASVSHLVQKLPMERVIDILESSVGSGKSVDPSKLLVGSDSSREIPSYREEWHLNLGLLMDVYQKTDDPAVKKQISFLALNYLAKAAPINIREIFGLDPGMIAEMEERFQFGLFQAMGEYHRERSTFEVLVQDEIKAVLAPQLSASGSPVLTDTADISILLPAYFSVVRTTPETNDQQLKAIWTNDLTDHLIRHLDQQREASQPLEGLINPPIVIDLTGLLGDIQTAGDPEKSEELEVRLKRYELLMDAAVSAAVQKIKMQRPKLFEDPENEKKLELFIRMNLICICTSKVKEMSFIKAVPLFNRPEEIEKHVTGPDLRKSARKSLAARDMYVLVTLQSFVNLTGLRLGAVRGREQIFNFMDLERLLKRAPDTLQGSGQIVDYAVQGKNVLYFPDPSAVTRSALLTRLERHYVTDAAIEKVPPHARVLALSAFQLIKGLMGEIDQDKWIALNANPDTREIIQTSLFRLMLHLGHAENQMHDFAKFTHAMELVHCELATLLAIVSPFKENDFPAIYKKQLDCVPSELAPFVKVGIAKSAMNIFAGINAAVKSGYPDLQRVHEAHSYYEEVNLIGANRTTADVLANSEIKRVDLYVGEFNHNINIDPTLQRYRPGDIQGEVDALLKAKPDTKHMTVAVDCTIDFIHSDKAKALLTHFSKEIKDGKLNFVFFRSGQKFDMLGMDNYYGGTFFMVNNGAAHWKPFDDLLTHDAFKTDPLSIQWFCLVNKYAPQATDAYRRQIFTNTRQVLDRVPEILLPGGNPHVRVNKVDAAMDPCFIDIKVSKNWMSDDEIEVLFHHTFASHKAKSHTRSSFGFYHPNLLAIKDTEGRMSIRVNPGLDPAEVGVHVEFLEELAKRVEAKGQNL